jgi:uncharacterized Zn-binding protein involved in type VI secretion
MTDITGHGSPLVPGPGSTNVLIGSLPAWRALMDFHVCPIVKGLVPDVGGMVLMGSPTVLINSMMACRVLDMVVEIPGGPNPILLGATNVFIGDSGGGGGGGAGGSNTGSGTERSGDASDGGGSQSAESQSGSASTAATAVSAASSGTKAEPREKTHWIKLRVLDDKSGLPISGIVLVIGLSENRTIQASTDRQGMVALEGLPDTTCSLTSNLKHATVDGTFSWISTSGGSESSSSSSGPEPWDSADKKKKATVIERAGARIAKVEEHKVRKGESLDTLASHAGMKVSELIAFNSQGPNPEDVNAFMRDYVGCTKREKGAYVFDDSDGPGLIFIPTPWKEESLPFDKLHEIRVQSACGFRITLRNEEALAIPEVKYEATFEGGDKRKGQLSRGGIALIKDAPAGDVEVFYPEYEDIEVKSLAASLRNAIEKKNAHTITNILHREVSLVTKVDQAYTKYFNDLSGKGLSEDICTQMKHPELEALVTLLLRAKLKVKNAADYIRWSDSK